MIEFEFHISPVWSSSRPQVGVGTSGTSSSRRPAGLGVVAQSDRARDGLVDIGDDAVPPAPDLVAEEPEAAQAASADRAARDHPALRAVSRRRRLLDDEAAARHVYLERRVVEVATLAAGQAAATHSKTFPFSRTECPPAPRGSQKRSMLAISGSGINHNP